MQILKETCQVFATDEYYAFKCKEIIIYSFNQILISKVALKLLGDNCGLHWSLNVSEKM